MLNYNTPYKQGRRLREDREVVPLKKVGGGDRSAFIPQYLENVLRFTV